MSSVIWNGTLLYRGEYISNLKLPWHYIPVWIVISTPILYSLCFLSGIYAVVAGFLKKPKQFYKKRRDDIVFLGLFLAPLAGVIIMKSALYDAWRQMFFIYGAFLMIAMIGIRAPIEAVKKRSFKLAHKIFIAAFGAALLLSMGNTMYFMIKNHPHQNVYFNKLAGKDMKDIKNKFELDYWGLSYRKALEYILENDPNKEIRILSQNPPGRLNADILYPDQRERLLFVKSSEKADYFIANYRWHKEEFPLENEFFSIKIGNAKIMVVYKK
jgi:hypothetical protein